MNPIKAVIFDLDGIIIDSEPWQQEAFDITMKPYNIYFNDEQFAKLIGIRSFDNFKEIVQNYHLDISPEKLTKIKNKNYLHILKRKIKPQKGLCELLHYLKPKYQLAIASGSIREDIELVIKMLHIKKYFPIITAGDEVTHSKPNPEIFIKTAEKLGLYPKECIVIEDSESGVNSAKNAGMVCIAVPTTSTKQHNFEKVDYVFNNLLEIKEIL